MPELTDKLIVALDCYTLSEAESIVKRLYPTVKMFKVGSQLFTSCGQEALKFIYQKGAKVFLDLKFLDIPNTVFSAVASGTGLSAVFMMTVHTTGGSEMLKAAVAGATKRASELKIVRPLIIGVTSLTSEKESVATLETVLLRARLARDAGLDGVVCSVNEAAKVRETLGRDFKIITPGIRPRGYKNDDQARVATAQEALKAGSDYLVVGRPILQADDPLKAVKDLL
jgi:orotidine-5'-phosphate decarboxylase